MNSASTERFIQTLNGVHPEIASSDVPPELKDTADGFFAPVAAVFPENREQLQQIVRLAAKMRTPLVPVSSGPPHTRCFAGVPGAVAISFQRMKRIFKIDEVSRYVWLEPGVTFGELLPELSKHGLRLNKPLLPRAGKSVVASLLEREPVLIPKYQYDYVDPLLTMEVVYGTGDDFRTGSASGPGTVESLKADKVNPWGPGSIDYMRLLTGAQGTMGFVSWAITKAELVPKLRKTYFLAADAVKQLVDIANNLLIKRVGDECLILNHVNLAVLFDAVGSGGGYVKALPTWTLVVCLAGYDRYPEERVAIQEKYLRELAGEFGLKPSEILPGAPGVERWISEALDGCSKEKSGWKTRGGRGCRDIFFLSPMSRTAMLTAVMEGEARANRFPDARLGVMIQPLVQGRGCHVEFSLFFDPSDGAELSAAMALFDSAPAALIEHGAYFSRPYEPWAELVYGRDPEGVTALKKLKAIFDPENILSPGKLCFRGDVWTA